MCNLYNLRVERWEYNEYFQTIDDSRNELAVEKTYAAPGKPGWVVRVEDGRRVLSTMKWGFPTRKPCKRPAREGEMPFLHDWWTNCRNLSSGMWRPWLVKPEHRCLVPFTQFSEPKAVADRNGPGDTAWWFTVTDQPEPCFAGVWKVDQDQDQDQDHDQVYTFCTTEPNALVAPKHPKAMPVILAAEDHHRWLNAPRRRTGLPIPVAAHVDDVTSPRIRSIGKKGGDATPGSDPNRASSHRRRET